MNRLFKTFIICLFLPVICGLSLRDAQKDYLLGDYSEAIRKARALRETDASLYFLGLAHIKTAEYLRARGYLGKLTRNFSRSQFYESGLIKLADSYFLEGNNQKAKKLYQKIEKEHFFSGNMSLVFLRLAQIAARQGNWEEKNEYLELIKKKYPQSSEIKFVKRLMSYGDFFTVQVGAFSSLKNARTLREDLKPSYQSYITEDKNSKVTLYKVRVGKFKKRFVAEKTAKELSKQGYPARIYP